MQRAAPTFGFVSSDELRALDPVLCCEDTERGWRGLTAKGEVFDVQAPDDEPRALTPKHEVFVVNGKGERIGRRAMPEASRNGGVIEAYLHHFNAAVCSLKQNDFAHALDNINIAIELVPTSRAKFNRSLILLSMERWQEGFADHEARFDLLTPPLCEEIESFGIPRWRGEDIAGMKLLLVHDAGFGDTIQMLRYVPALKARMSVTLYMPPELKRFAAQVAPIYEFGGADCYCPMLSLPHALRQTTPNGGMSEPYLAPNESDFPRFRASGFIGRIRIGIAWSVGRNVIGDYPRAISLALLVKALRKRHPGVELYSLQKQGDVLASSLGVNVLPMRDFADCAVLATFMDEIVTVDTACAHLAGAIGHPNVTVLLPWWSSWRWREDQLLYKYVRLCRQDEPGNWDSALAKL
jgi:Glycosyltransferase family 9 (heptosyltransferase)